jgi:hypothetical protein
MLGTILIVLFILALFGAQQTLSALQNLGVFSRWRIRDYPADRDRPSGSRSNMTSLRSLRMLPHASAEVYVRQSSQRFPFLPSGLQVSLETSAVQATNKTTGAALSLIKEIDVEKRLAARRAMRLGWGGPLSRPGAQMNPAPKVTNAPAFIEDVAPGHSSLGASVIPIPIAADSDGPRGFTVPRSVQL